MVGEAFVRLEARDTRSTHEITEAVLAEAGKKGDARVEESDDFVT
jgi:hypothetical protein